MYAEEFRKADDGQGRIAFALSSKPGPEELGPEKAQVVLAEKHGLPEERLRLHLILNKASVNCSWSEGEGEESYLKDGRKVVR